MKNKIGEAVVIFLISLYGVLIAVCLCLLNVPVKTEIVEVEKTVETVKEVLPESEFECLGEFTVTAYCPYEDEWGNVTAKPYNGEYIAVEGVTVAVDPEIIPYGSVIVIDGHSYIAHDCGSKVKGRVIDIYFDSIEKMNEWGKRVKSVYIVKDNSIR